MAITHSLRTIWAPAVLEALQKSLVYGRMFNQDYSGVASSGNAVKVSALNDATINDHTRNDAISWEALTDSIQTLDIDQEKYFALMIDDLDNIQTAPNLLGAATRNAVYGIRDTIDQFLVSKLAAGTIVAGLGTSATPLEINSSNIEATLRLIARRLDDAKVPRAQRYIIVPPWAVEDLVQANITAATNNTEEMASGMVGRYAGMSVLVSHNVPNVSNAKYQIYAGSTVSQTMAVAVENVESMRLESYFADGVRGLVAYGALVTRPAALVKSFWNEAA